MYNFGTLYPLLFTLYFPVHHGLENQTAIGASEKGLAGSFWVGHEPHNIPLAVTNSSNVFERSVGVSSRGCFAMLVTVTENNLMLCFKFF